LLKKISRFLATIFLPFIASLAMRFIYATNKKNFHIPQDLEDDATIFACWHGELLMITCMYAHFRKKPNISILISPHFDGILISKTVKYFGFKTIAGSSNKDAARTLIKAMKTLKSGCDIGITPDGPKGPRHEVANGVIVMAQKTNKKVVCLNIVASKYWQLNSWDKFIIPKPFGELDFYATQPLDLSGMGLEDARELIKRNLEQHEN